MANLYKKALANIANTRSTLNQNRRKDYNFSTDVLGTLYSQLLGQVRGGQKRMSLGNERQMAAMAKLAARAQQGRSAVRNARQASLDEFGGVYQGAANTAYQPAAARAKGGALVGAAQAQTGRQFGKLGNQLMQIANAGAREAQAGASYALTQANTQRAKADATTIAQLRQQVILQRMSDKAAMARQQAQIDAQYGGSGNTDKAVSNAVAAGEQGLNAESTPERIRALAGTLATQFGLSPQQQNDVFDALTSFATSQGFGSAATGDVVIDAKGTTVSIDRYAGNAATQQFVQDGSAQGWANLKATVNQDAVTYGWTPAQATAALNAARDAWMQLGGGGFANQMAPIQAALQSGNIAEAAKAYLDAWMQQNPGAGQDKQKAALQEWLNSNWSPV